MKTKKGLVYSTLFSKHFQKRISPSINLRKKYDQRVTLFLKNPSNPFLRDHTLKGKKTNLRAFSITGDVRVLYQEFPTYYLFVDIGTHNQVY